MREDLEAYKASLVLVVSGYDVVAAQTVHARKSYDHGDIRFGHRYADILDTSDDGRLRIDYGRFHDDRWRDRLSYRRHANIVCETRRERAKIGSGCPGAGTSENPAAHYSRRTSIACSNSGRATRSALRVGRVTPRGQAAAEDARPEPNDLSRYERAPG